MRIVLASVLAVACFGCRGGPPASAPQRPGTSVEPYEPLAGDVRPLPHEFVAEMFHQICRNKVTDLSLVYQSLVGPQTALRAEAARYLGSHGDEASVPHLIDALRDQTCHVGAEYPSAGMATTRYWANDSLKRLTGEDFGFVWEDPIGERDQAVSRWRDWYEGTHKGR